MWKGVYCQLIVSVLSVPFLDIYEWMSIFNRDWVSDRSCVYSGRKAALLFFVVPNQGPRLRPAILVSTPAENTIDSDAVQVDNFQVQYFHWTQAETLPVSSRDRPRVCPTAIEQSYSSQADRNCWAWFKLIQPENVNLCEKWNGLRWFLICPGLLVPSRNAEPENLEFFFSASPTHWHSV